MKRTFDILKKKLDEGRMIVGAGTATTDESFVDVMGYHHNLDVLWIEMEHSHLDLPAIYRNTLVAQSHDMAVVVRMPWNDPVRVKPLLDLGVDGLIFPMIKTADDVRLAVASCKYPPVGIRGFAPGRAAGYGTISDEEYLKTADDSVFVTVQIEQKEAVENIEEICQVPGLNCVLIGCSDLSASYGHLQQIKTPDIYAAIDKICDTAKKYGVTLACCMPPTDEYMKHFLERGIQIYIGGGDSGWVAAGSKAYAERLLGHAKAVGR
ncbi:hypothetical protein LJC33_02665 [Eubacteriales bacterium OttesenSCG-928-N13]|nr:hypothetical protein [Eubacteriales bacterium OttesenSCG-928-N13]